MQNVSSARPFHTVLVARIASLDIMNPDSVALATRIKEDVTLIKIKANKILKIAGDLQEKMAEVAGADNSAYVGQVCHELTQANVGIQAQIAAYRQNGKLPNEQTAVDDSINIGADVKLEVAGATTSESIGNESVDLRHLNGAAIADQTQYGDPDGRSHWS